MTAKTEKKTPAPKKAPKVTPKEPVNESRICKECGKPYESKYSGSLYCPECAVVKKRERRKAAGKRRLVHRRDELQDLRQMKVDILAALDGTGTKQDIIDKIEALIK